MEHSITSHPNLVSHGSQLSQKQPPIPIESEIIYLFSRWVINLVCAALMCVTGEFLCMRTELRTIPVNMAGGGASANQPKTDHL